MIIAGWGKDAKKIGTKGIELCPRCNNYNIFNLYEVKKKISLYFVPIAKWDAKFFFVCPTCEEAIELSEADKNVALRESVTLPSEHAMTAIWEELDRHLASKATDIAKSTDPQTEMEPAITRLKALHPAEEVNYVAGKFLDNMRLTLAKAIAKAQRTLGQP